MTDVLDPKSSRARILELEEQIKAKDDYIVKLQLRLIRIEAVAEQVHNAFKPGARLPHEQTKALTDLALAVRELPANPESRLRELEETNNAQARRIFELSDELKTRPSGEELARMQALAHGYAEENEELREQREQAETRGLELMAEVQKLTRERDHA
jgi:uncharacterized coiled-coil protein SlyX